MKMNVLFLIVFTALFAFAGYCVYKPAPAPTCAVSFSDVEAARATLESRAFHCTSDKQDGRLGSGFMVSRAPMTPSEVCCLGKGGQVGPEWKGKVWLAQISMKDNRLQTAADDSNTRTWGNVLAFGDRELMDEIEGLLKESH